MRKVLLFLTITMGFGKYPDMKILIFGAGVIGITYAWQLQEAGHDVSLLVRPLRMVRYSHSGVSINYTDLRDPKKDEGQTVFRPKVIDKLMPSQAFDLIIVTVRSNQWHDAMPYIAKHSGNAHILLMGNIWSHPGFINKYLPRNRYFLGFPDMVAGGQTDNGINCFLFNNACTMLGEPEGKKTERLQKTVEIFKASGLQPDICRRMKDWLPTRYLVSAILPGLISKAGTTRLFAANSALVKQYLMALKEGLKVCRKRNIERVSLFPFNRFYFPSFILTRLIRRQFSPEMQSALDAHMKHGSAEKIKQYHDVLRTGKNFKVSMPYWASFEKYMDFS